VGLRGGVAVTAAWLETVSCGRAKIGSKREAALVGCKGRIRTCRFFVRAMEPEQPQTKRRRLAEEESLWDIEGEFLERFVPCNHGMHTEGSKKFRVFLSHRGGTTAGVKEFALLIQRHLRETWHRSLCR